MGVNREKDYNFVVVGMFFLSHLTAQLQIKRDGKRKKTTIYVHTLVLLTSMFRLFTILTTNMFFNLNTFREKKINSIYNNTTESSRTDY
jgi:hypothetical protein